MVQGKAIAERIRGLFPDMEGESGISASIGMCVTSVVEDYILFSCACSGRSAYRRYFFRREMSSRRFFYKKKSGEGITGGTGEYHRNTGKAEGEGA